MNHRLSLTAIILTYNEEIHLQRCLSSLQEVCTDIVVVDSFSSDATEQIANANSCRFYQNPWTNHAVQFNWALDNCEIKTDWVLRLDADEYLYKEDFAQLRNAMETADAEVSGFTLKLVRFFMRREMKRMPQIRMLRLFRNGKGRSEIRWMDEHIQLESGRVEDLHVRFADNNLNTIGWWTDKHNSYSIREAIDLLDVEYNILGNEHRTNLDGQAKQKRKMKLKYAKSPLFLRAMMYFVYRYFFKLGLLDGKEGFLWNFLQGWWYRTLVDAKVYEIKKHCGRDINMIKSYILKNYKIKL
ncbi:glycosyltransferase family 2 protein [Chryseobacterium foetidum]|uniref:glycosyltransferase family 2 protein n=1 Tax=Chryseobacterium foetidum TaxID=2951057 RepID=UPI0021C5A5F5|nr:glycosyltransferase family 2 protein [Chryseobacterium foetidum]